MISTSTRVDPSVVCVRTSASVLKLPSVALALKVATDFINKNFKTFYQNVDQLTTLLTTSLHPVQGIQTNWTQVIFYLIEFLTGEWLGSR